MDAPLHTTNQAISDVLPVLTVTAHVDWLFRLTWLTLLFIVTVAALEVHVEVVGAEDLIRKPISVRVLAKICAPLTLDTLILPLESRWTMALLVFADATPRPAPNDKPVVPFHVGTLPLVTVPGPCTYDVHPVELPLAIIPVGAAPAEHGVGSAASAVAVATFTVGSYAMVRLPATSVNRMPVPLISGLFIPKKER